MAKKRKICVVTGSRAEYGLLYWLLQEIQNDPQLQLQLCVTGMHLSPKFGSTYKTIEKDGFVITAKVDNLLEGDSAVATTQSIGRGLMGFAETFARLKPDIVVMLGDRFEIFAAAQAALIARIPIAHIHGGESTEGAYDEAIRHSITKMSLWHFPAAEAYRQRTIQLGESPKNVFHFGSISLDNIYKLKLLTRQQLEKSLGFKFGKINFLITHHPVTLRKSDTTTSELKALLSALDRFPEAHLLFTYANADTGGRALITLVEKYVKKNPGRAAAFASLGQLKYLSALSMVNAVIGNSSSGLVEAPALACPTINIGPRQTGRLCASSVINTSGDREAIVFAIKKALSPAFQHSLKNIKAPYGSSGQVSRRIKNQLKKVSLNEEILMKKFYDLKN